MAIEMVHCFSLIYDDLPCMDDDDMRRGKPTVHIKFNEENALLGGASLLVFSYQLLASKNFKATALSLAVWFSVFGSVFGPRLVSLYSEYFNELFNSELIVGYIVAMVGMLFASASVITFTSSNSLLRKPAETEENNVYIDETYQEDEEMYVEDMEV